MTLQIDEQYTAACFTSGPTEKEFIAIHWWDAPENHPTIESVIDTFVSGRRQTSAHYAATEGYAACFVNPDDVAWANGNWEANLRGISIECNPRQNDGDYEAVAEVVRHIRSIYGDLPLRRHNEFFPTQCPGNYDLERIDALARNLEPIESDVTPGEPVSPLPPVPSTNNKSVEQLADEVLAGAYGNGDERRLALGAAYDEVQAVINARLAGVPNPEPSISDLADQVLNGAFGNGDQRRVALGGRYQAVQDEINRRLGAAPAPQQSNVKSISQLVDETLAGVYGNGDERINALGPIYQAVQDEINRRSNTGRVISVNDLADAVIRGEYGDGEERRAKLGVAYDAVQAEINRRYS